MSIIQVLPTNRENNDDQYLKLISSAFEQTKPSTIYAAVAYATVNGVKVLEETLSGFKEWKQVRKKWLVGVDYCRSDPLALEHLASLRQSQVRVFDGSFVSTRKSCVPRVSFHPKMYMFKRKQTCSVVVGSGNLSYTGLCAGVEAGVRTNALKQTAVKELAYWFNREWRQSSILSDVIDAYSLEYEDKDNRTLPVPNEDDIVPKSSSGRGHLDAVQLRRLRVCQNLWIQAGNLHSNRGPNRPGNQLMMKRNSRVFFGFPARDLPEDSHLGYIEIDYTDGTKPDCSLRYSNNSMDVLTLPVPEECGLDTYNQRTLCFTRTGLRKFKISVGDKQKQKTWKQKSKSVKCEFKMSSGREWGVF